MLHFRSDNFWNAERAIRKPCGLSFGLVLSPFLLCGPIYLVMSAFHDPPPKGAYTICERPLIESTSTERKSFNTF